MLHILSAAAPIVTTAYTADRPLRYHTDYLVYADGSALSCGALGAAYHNASSGATTSATVAGHASQINTVLRAELVAIYMSLRDTPNVPSLTILPDSQCSIQLIRKALYSPDAVKWKKHKVLLLHIVHNITCRLHAGTTVHIQKVRAHIGVSGNEIADGAARHAAHAGAAHTATPTAAPPNPPPPPVPPVHRSSLRGTL